ncbi:MAG: hypothetical protein AVDCRST_MAG02-880, partial [uncultured Rubrobacteraceae bacterium]
GREKQDLDGGARRGRGHARLVRAARGLEEGGVGLRHRPDAGSGPGRGARRPGGLLSQHPAGPGRDRARRLRHQHRGRLRPLAPGERGDGRGGGRRLFAGDTRLGRRVVELAAAGGRPLAPVGAAEPQSLAPRHRPRRLRGGVGPDLRRPDPRPPV